ncbi:hypothetical protein LTR53_012038 [Teratosphaeriaceae sp. CCFEE 6253]|nr:hypothetical protein LTR53_012038 [Teratosphaeriaceae sp. CCFEE 6253]
MGFIDDGEHPADDNEPEVDGSSDTEVQEVVHHAQSRRRRGGAVVISDDEEDAGTAPADAISIESSDDEAPVLGTVGRTKRNRAAPIVRSRPVVLSDESSDDESTAHEQPNLTNGGFSPLEETSDGESTVDPQPSYTNEDYETSDNDDSAPSLRFDQSDATSEAEPMLEPAHQARATARSSSDEDSEDSENGYDSATTDATAEPPAVTRDNNNRLQTNTQRRDRYRDAPTQQPAHRLPLTYVSARSRATAHHAPASTLSRGGASAPQHPFNLSNTLAEINDRSRAEREPSTESSDYSSSEPSTSGGVVVGASRIGPSSESSRVLGRMQSSRHLGARGKRPGGRVGEGGTRGYGSERQG